MCQSRPNRETRSSLVCFWQPSPVRIFGPSCRRWATCGIRPGACREGQAWPQSAAPLSTPSAQPSACRRGHRSRPRGRSLALPARSRRPASWANRSLGLALAKGSLPPRHCPRPSAFLCRAQPPPGPPCQARASHCTSTLIRLHAHRSCMVTRCSCKPADEVSVKPPVQTHTERSLAVCFQRCRLTRSGPARLFLGACTLML